MPDPADLRTLSAPFVTQLAERTSAVLSPQPAAGSFERQQRLLTDGSAIRPDRHQRRDRPAMSGNDRRLALFSCFKKIGKLIAGFFCAFAPRRAHCASELTVQHCTDVCQAGRRAGDGRSIMLAVATKLRDRSPKPDPHFHKLYLSPPDSRRQIC